MSIWEIMQSPWFWKIGVYGRCQIFKKNIVDETTTWIWSIKSQFNNKI